MSTSFPAIDELIASYDVRLSELADERERLLSARTVLATQDGHSPVNAPASAAAPRRRARRSRNGRARRGEVPAAILRLLADGVARTPKQLAAELGYPTPKVSSAITPLNKDGLIRKPDDGRRGWTLPAA